MSYKAINARRVAWAAISLAAATLLSMNTQASGAYAPAQKAVDYSDLDLAAPADVKALYTRLRTAAKDVCGTDTKYLRQIKRQRECYREAMASAVATVNHNSVTALYASDRSLRLVQRKGDMPSRS